MWGTIARMRMRPDVPHEYLMAQARALNAERMRGLLYTSFYRSDTDPRDYWMVAMFESKEAYRANAESRAQNAVYEMMRACLESEPQWNDVDEVLTIPPRTPAG